MTKTSLAKKYREALRNLKVFQEEAKKRLSESDTHFGNWRRAVSERDEALARIEELKDKLFEMTRKWERLRGWADRVESDDVVREELVEVMVETNEHHGRPVPPRTIPKRHLAEPRSMLVESDLRYDNSLLGRSTPKKSWINY